MNLKNSDSFNGIVTNLEAQIKLYRHLLDIVRKEKELLISGQIDELNENNKAKEAMLLKLKQLELERKPMVNQLCGLLGISIQEGRLLELAKYLSAEQSDRIRNLHSVLSLLLKRVQELNGANEKLVQSALAHITGAMKAITDTLKENPVYQKQGVTSSKGTSSGRLVSREA